METKSSTSKRTKPNLCETSKMASSWEVNDDMNFYLTPEKFIIEPNGKNEVLIIDRITQETRVQTKLNQIPAVGVRRICGLLGTIELINGFYLIVATHRIFVGLINNQAIWRLAGFDIIPYIQSTAHLKENQIKQNEYYVAMIKQTLDMPHYYFSYTYDISHTLQRLHSMPPEFLRLGLFERADSRFVWNGHLLKGFQKDDLKNYCLPLILGYVSANKVNINGNTFSWILLSRRSIQRAGTRLFSRGIDVNGNVSNFVETEQVIEYSNDKVSFVQTRGSIPVYWRQSPNLKYKPIPEITPGKDHQLACAKHFDSQLLQYGRQVAVNLIDHRGPEELLEKAFKNMVAQLNNIAVRYEAFDFHQECRKMKYERLNILIDRLAHEQDEFGVFHLRDGMLLSMQDGVFRTNCIDCLDRTNVVQSMLARRSLTNILQKLQILLRGQTIEQASGFEALYRNAWADNADLISTQYSGTGALKTDFTRTGKRTKAGLLQDGVNSMTRYYKNNFRDGFRQDAIDLFLGSYVVQKGECVTLPCPLDAVKGWRFWTFPSVLMVAVAMFFASTVLPSEYNTEQLLFIMFWGSMVGVTATGILRYGKEFVDSPKLVPQLKGEP